MSEKKPGIIRYIGLGVLAIVWLWLAWFVLARAGVTLINIFWVVASGIIVFVPLYKKYFNNNQ